MPWLWFAGPLTFLFLVVIFNLWPTAEERRLRFELGRWLDEMLGPLRSVDSEEQPREVPHLPPVLARLVTARGGSRIADVVLVPGLAYLAVRAADAVSSSNHYTLVCKLVRRAPRIEVRPLQIIDGQPVENDGVPFDDPDFADHYVVEGDNPGAIKQWLHQDVREALMQFPDLWLRTDGATMSLTYYGSADAEMIDELLEVADVIFAEYGAGVGESLFGEPDDVQPDGYRDMVVDEDEDELDYEDGDEVIEVLATKQERAASGVIDFGLYALGGVLLVAVLGHFPGFHPSVLFNSPDLVVTQPWQGGWTTKGFGALVAVESYLLGILSLQAYLAVKSGQSIGKLLVGIQVNRIDGEERTFVRLVLLRKWLFLAVPLAAAVALSRPFSARAMFSNIPNKITGAAALAIGAVILVSWVVNRSHRGIHDLVAGTEVVRCEPYRLPSVQLSVWKNDPIAGRRLVFGACAMVFFIGLNLVTVAQWDAWLLEVHQWR